MSVDSDSHKPRFSDGDAIPILRRLAGVLLSLSCLRNYTVMRRGVLPVRGDGPPEGGRNSAPASGSDLKQ